MESEETNIHPHVSGGAFLSWIRCLSPVRILASALYEVVSMMASMSPKSLYLFQISNYNLSEQRCDRCLLTRRRLSAAISAAAYSLKRRPSSPRFAYLQAVLTAGCVTRIRSGSLPDILRCLLHQAKCPGIFEGIGCKEITRLSYGAIDGVL